MAEVIDQMPRRKRGRPPIYDWDQTFDNNIHRWFQGTEEEFKSGAKDFAVPLASFRALVHRTASAREDGPWKAETQIDKKENSVAFRFYRPNEAP